MGKFVVNELKVAQITIDSLLKETTTLLSGREAFRDTTPIDEAIYQGDVFDGILEECGAKVINISSECLEQLNTLSEEVKFYDYIYIL